VDTVEIDGQSNLILKSRVNSAEDIGEENPFDYVNSYVNSKITFDEPNSNIAIFRGQLESVGEIMPLTESNLLLRKSVLRRTDYVFAVVIYTGHNTKVMQMQLTPRTKSSKIYGRIQRIMFVMLLLSLCSSIFAAAYNIVYIYAYQESMANFINYEAFNYLLWFVTKFVNWILLTLFPNQQLRPHLPPGRLRPGQVLPGPATGEPGDRPLHAKHPRPRRPTEVQRPQLHRKRNPWANQLYFGR
jgi:phospholipid-transporting ATPase